MKRIGTKMKRFLCICIVTIMLFSGSACGKVNKESTDSVTGINETNIVTESNEIADNIECQEFELENSKAQDENDATNASENMVESQTTEAESVTETTNNNTEDADSVTAEADKKSDKSQEVTDIVNKTSDSKEEQYVGEYNAYDIDEPGLQIQKNDDGTYKIQIGIYRLIQLDECVGESTENGIVFFTKELGDKDISGTITIEDDIATVTFTGSDWSTYSEINEYKYYKSSDVPNIYEP